MPDNHAVQTPEMNEAVNSAFQDPTGYWRREALVAQSDNRALMREIHHEKRITLAYGVGLLLSWSLLVAVCAGWV